MDITIGQVKNRLEHTLDAIWRLGDRDECSNKHIGHSLAAVSYGKTWEDGVDYPTPWDQPPATYVKSTGEFREWTTRTIKAKEKRLRESWSMVEALRDEVGLPTFNAAVSASKFHLYWATYCDTYWKRELT